MKNIGFILLIIITTYSCGYKPKIKTNNYCGLELSRFEKNILEVKAQNQGETIYQSDSLFSVYEQVNHSLRSFLPDSVEFEIFLNTLDSAHFSIVVIAPKNKELLKSISCNFFDIELNGDAPKKRIITCYSYNEKDENGESPFEFALKSI